MDNRNIEEILKEVVAILEPLNATTLENIYNVSREKYPDMTFDSVVHYMRNKIKQGQRFTIKDDTSNRGLSSDFYGSSPCSNARSSIDCGVQSGDQPTPKDCQQESRYLDHILLVLKIILLGIIMKLSM